MFKRFAFTAAFATFLAVPAHAAPQIKTMVCSGGLNVAMNDSSVGECSFLERAPVAKKIYAVCRTDAVCSIEVQTFTRNGYTWIVDNSSVTKVSAPTSEAPQAMITICQGMIGGGTVVDSSGKEVCSFLTSSAVSKRIYDTCPRDGECRIEAVLENNGGDLMIAKVINVEKITVPQYASCEGSITDFNAEKNTIGQCVLRDTDLVKFVYKNCNGEAVEECKVKGYGERLPNGKTLVGSVRSIERLFHGD